jgi:serpin B
LINSSSSIVERYKPFIESKMRCLIVIALCFLMANATYLNKNRFQRLLNRYQNQDRLYQDQDLFQNQYDIMDNLYGQDDLDENVNDYMDEIRRERLYERDQCPRDIDELSDLFQDDEYDTSDDLEDMRRGRYSQFDDLDDMRRQGRYYDNEDESEINSGSSSELLQEIEDANAKLASRLYKQSKDEKDDKNTVVSPISVQLALAALNRGARGNTKRQIARVIAGRLQKQERQQVFRALARHLRGNRQNDYSSRQQRTKIQPVTGIIVSKTTPAQQQFVQTVRRNLNAHVKQCNFQRQPQQCRQMINRLVSQKTQGKINQIVPQDAITDNTKMILVNALQLKAPWGQQMRRHITKEAKFYPLDTKKVKIVEVMETQGQYKYYEDELVKIVGIPTEQHKLTLYVIVPKDKDGLTDVEKMHLQDSQQLKQLLDVADQRVRQVGVQLPKFQIKHKIDVRRTLRKQGVTDAFDPQRADFSGITGRNPQLDQEYGMEDSREQQSFRRYRRNPFLANQMQDELMMSNVYGQQETKLHLNKFIHQTTIKITEQGITATSGSQSPFEHDQQDEQLEEVLRFSRQSRQGLRGDLDIDELSSLDEFRQQGQQGQQGQKIVKANHAFAFAIKHNPTNQLVMVGRVIDAAQKKTNHVQQTINNVDQL